MIVRNGRRKDEEWKRNIVEKLRNKGDIMKEIEEREGKKRKEMEKIGNKREMDVKLGKVLEEEEIWKIRKKFWEIK